MNKLSPMLTELIFLSYWTLKIESVNQKVYLEFGRGIAKISEKSLTAPRGFVILKFGHEHFIHFYFSDGPLTQCFISILLWKPQSVPKLLGHSFWWQSQGTNKGKHFHVWDCPSPHPMGNMLTFMISLATWHHCYYGYLANRLGTPSVTLFNYFILWLIFSDNINNKSR